MGKKLKKKFKECRGYKMKSERLFLPLQAPIPTPRSTINISSASKTFMYGLAIYTLSYF